MWTLTTRAPHRRDDLWFASDVTDAEWAVLAPLLPSLSPVGRTSAWLICEIVNAIFSVPCCGIPWRMPPDCFPPWQTVYGRFFAFRDKGAPLIGHG